MSADASTPDTLPSSQGFDASAPGVAPERWDEARVAAYLDALDGYPSGDEAAWWSRYSPLVAARLDHRVVADPLISVVVVAWRSAHLVVECLDHVRAQRGLPDGAIEVILVDNGGLEPARDAFPTRVDVELRMQHNVGLSPARNLGLLAARAPIVCFIDDDGLIAADYCRRALDYFAHDPDLVAARSRITYKHHRYFTTLASHYDRGPHPVADCLVTEGSMAIRRQPYLEVGGFAEKLYGHEGIDLTFRLKQHNPRARVLYVPDMVMAHDYIHTWQKFWQKNTRYTDINTRVAARSPELEAFMADYARHQKTFKTSRKTTDELAAMWALKAARAALRQGARLSQRASRS